VGRAYRYLGRNDEALSWLRPTLAWSERLGDGEWTGFCCYELGFVLAAQGRDRTALAYLNRAKKLLTVAGILDWGDWGTKQWDLLHKKQAEVVARAR